MTASIAVASHQLEVSQHAPRSEVARGVADALTLLVGYVAFALLVGTRVVAGGSAAARLASTVLVFGGSAQLAVLQLLDAGAPVLAVIGTGILVNARLLAYSASLAPRWAGTSRRFRILAATSVIDPTWALAERRERDPGTDAQRRTYYVSAAATIGLGWTALVVLGAVLGASGFKPVGEVAVPLCLLQLVLPRVLAPGAWRPAAAAAVVAWFAAGSSPGVAVLLAVAAALAMQRVSGSPRKEQQKVMEHQKVEVPS